MDPGAFDTAEREAQRSRRSSCETRRRRKLPLTRAVQLALGLGALVFAWLGPAALIAPGPFSAHMATHMAVVAVAAPLLAAGLAGSRLDPVRRFPALFPPVPASLVELIVVWSWHSPALHHLARHSIAGLVAEQSMFLGSGLLVWLAAAGGPRPGGKRKGAGVLALLLTSMHMTLLGALLALPARPLYAHAAHAAKLAPLDDQHLGGAIMLVAGGVSYLAGGLWLAAGLLRHRPPLTTPQH
jgi:putative membrane protein